MPDSVLHVVLDANILTDYLHKNATESLERVKRSKKLISAVTTSKWPRIKLYTPAICIAETLGAIDKYRFATWKGDVKANPLKKLSQEDYKTIRDRLFEMVNSEDLEQLEHEPKHTLMSSLISPVNCDFHDKGERNKNKIMGATDCVIIGMATHLTNRLGAESVILVTGDSRMAKVTEEAKNLSNKKAEELGVINNATKLGIEWSNEIYPKVINLNSATDSKLKVAFGGWPLPDSEISYPQKNETKLNKSEADNLYEIWKNIKSQKEYMIPNERLKKLVEPTIDKLPYTKAIDAIQIQYAIQYGVYITCKVISWSLLNKRKANKSDKSKEPDSEEDRQGLLFGHD